MPVGRLTGKEACPARYGRRMLDRIKAHLLSDARDWWRWWSMRVMALGAILHGWVTFAAGSVLWVWRMLPERIERMIPYEVISAVTIALFVLAMVMRLLPQRKLQAKSGARNAR